MAEQVLIEFISDTSQLASSTDILEQQGKITKQNTEEFKKENAEIVKQQKALQGIGAITKQIDATGKITKANLADLSKIIKSQSQEFQQEIKKGVVESLKAAGVSAEELETALTGVKGETSSLKAELREMVTALQEMKVAGQDNTEEYTNLAKKAGELKDAIGDANQEVKNFGSDTSNLDGLLSLAGGVTGVFAAGQGAVALFGEESEDLQQTLLRVNAAMAVLQGLQQIQTVLQKESAAATFANTIATNAQTAALTLFNFVVGSSTGLLRVFRIALAATGIGLLVIGVIALVDALKSSNDELEDANKLIEQQKGLLDALNESVEKNAQLQEARLVAAGALESEILKSQGRAILAQIDNLIEVNRNLAIQRDSLDNTTEAYKNLNDQIIENNKAIDKLNASANIKSLEVQKKQVQERLKAIVDGFAAQLAATRKNSKDELEVRKLLVKAERDVALEAAGQNEAERRRIIAESNDKIRDLNKEFQEVLQNDRIAAIEASLSAEETRARAIGERTTQKEIDLQKKLVQEKADLELLQEGLTQNQILEIKTKSINDQVKLQRDFNKQLQKEVLDDLISRNSAELSQIEVGDAKKLALTIENITAAAQIEVATNHGNSDKIKEINARRDADIRAARIASIQAIADYEIQITQARSGVLLRVIEKELQAQDQIRGASNAAERKRIEKQTGFQRTSVQEQIRLIDLLTSYEAGSIQKRIDALNEQLSQRLISEKDYKLQYEQLVDQQAQIFENSEKRKTEIANAESEKRRQKTIDDISRVLEVAQAVVGVLDSLYQLQSANENNALEQRKSQLKELQDAGAITEKEAIARQKRIDAEERRIRREQAERDKKIAIFQAAIGVPIAVIKGLREGGPILAAIYGAIAAAQLILVSARPIPKFGKGKKNNYQGLAEVGETGSELIESNGKMYVANKPQIVWLGKEDKVFNPTETAAMLSGNKMNTERLTIPVNKSEGVKFDYEKMGKAVGKHLKTDVYVDGVHAQHIEKQLFEQYLGGRRAFK